MKIVYAATTATIINPNDGLPLMLVESEVWAADDPLVKARPDLFSDAPQSVRRTVPAVAPIETATKAPGARKGVKREEW